MADSMHVSFELTQQHTCNRSLCKEEKHTFMPTFEYSDVSSFVEFVAHAVNELCETLNPKPRRPHMVLHYMGLHTTVEQDTH